MFKNSSRFPAAPIGVAEVRGRLTPSAPRNNKRFAQPSSVASSVISAFSSFDTGQPALAFAVRSSNVA